MIGKLSENFRTTCNKESYTEPFINIHYIRIQKELSN